MKTNTFLAVLFTIVALALTGCADKPIVLKDAVAEAVHNCKGKVTISYTNKKGVGESVNATCENSNTEEVVTTKGTASDPSGFQKSIRRTYW